MDFETVLVETTDVFFILETTVVLITTQPETFLTTFAAAGTPESASPVWMFMGIDALVVVKPSFL